jgi:surface protein
MANMHFLLLGFIIGSPFFVRGYSYKNGIVTCPDEFPGQTFNVTQLNLFFTKVNRTMLDGYKLNSDDYHKFTTSCTTGVLDMNKMFYNQSTFNSSISTWDTSSVTNMNGMFQDALSFNSSISNWTTSSVLDMSYMFSRATSFNSDISKWDTSNVTNMMAMFNGVEKFNSNISNWNTSNVLYLTWMFLNAQSFNSDISEWDTTSVLDMKVMFDGALKFNQSLTNWCVNISEPTRFSTGSPIDSNLAFQPLWNGTGCTNKCYNGIRNTSDYSCICVDEFTGIFCDKGTTTTLTSTITSTLTSISNKPPNETTSSKLSSPIIVVIVLSVCFAIFGMVIIIWFIKRNQSTGNFIPIRKTSKITNPAYLLRPTPSPYPVNNSYDLQKAAQTHNSPFNTGQEIAKEFFYQKKTKNTPHERNFNQSLIKNAVK